MLRGGNEKPCIYQITKNLVPMATKKRNRILGQSSEMLLYNSGLYILFINIQILFFPKKGLYPGRLMSEGAYNRKDLYVLNLVGL